MKSASHFGSTRMSFLRRSDEAPSSEVSRFAFPFLVDQRKIRIHIIESLEDRFQRNLEVSCEFFRRAGIRAVYALVDHGGANPPTPEE
jgi:hypothetical protein